MLTGVAAKISWDVALLMQTEVAEAAEPSAAGRGGSSTLPHKRNPVAGAAVSLRAPPGQRARLGRPRRDDRRARAGARWLAGRVGDADLAAPAGRRRGRARPRDRGRPGDRRRRDGSEPRPDRRDPALRTHRLRLGPVDRQDEATRAVQEAAASSESSGRSFADELLAHPVLASHLCGRAVADYSTRAATSGRPTRSSTAHSPPTGDPEMPTVEHKGAAISYRLDGRTVGAGRCSSPTRWGRPPQCGTTRCPPSPSASGDPLRPPRPRRLRRDAGPVLDGAARGRRARRARGARGAQRLGVRPVDGRCGGLVDGRPRPRPGRAVGPLLHRADVRARRRSGPNGPLTCAPAGSSASSMR